MQLCSGWCYWCSIGIGYDWKVRRGSGNPCFTGCRWKLLPVDQLGLGPWAFLLFLFASACCESDCSKLDRPFCTVCLQAVRSEATASQVVRSISMALKSLLQTSLYRSWSLPVGRLPCASSPWRSVLGILPSSMRTTCLSQRMRLCFSSVYMLRIPALSLLFLSGSQGPGLIAVQEGAEGTGSVDLDFCVLSQLVFGPYSLCQSRHGRGCFADALVDLHVENEGNRDKPCWNELWAAGGPRLNGQWLLRRLQRGSHANILAGPWNLLLAWRGWRAFHPIWFWGRCPLWQNGRRFSMKAKKIGARMQPCFTPLLMFKASEVEPSKTTVPFMTS